MMADEAPLCSRATPPFQPARLRRSRGEETGTESPRPAEKRPRHGVKEATAAVTTCVSCLGPINGEHAILSACGCIIHTQCLLTAHAERGVELLKCPKAQCRKVVTAHKIVDARGTSPSPVV